jgi:NTP pyrophosphatase (non-canonical NTP hydrolase)
MDDSEKYKKLLSRIKTFNNDRNWSQFHDPKNLALSLQLETSEVLELFQWTQDNQLKNGKESEIPKELADVFYYLVMLAEHYKVDLVAALEEKMTENENKYPIEKAKDSSAKYTDL